MKRWLLTLFTVCLIVGLTIPAYAAEFGDNPVVDQPIQQEEEPVVVSTLEELQAAVDAAEDGDTIYLSKGIWMNGISLICDKNVTIKGLEQVSYLFCLSGDSELSGFNFIVGGSTVALVENNGFRVCNIKISDCQFIGNGNDYNNLINIFSGNVKLQN